MSDPGQENPTTAKPQELQNSTHQKPQARSLQPKIAITVTTKKKKEVISIESSSERLPSKQPQSPKASDPHSSVYSKPLKHKKTTFKCQLCKGTGRKSEMKSCTGCKSFCHIQCLDENETKKKYVCDKCKAAQMEQSKANKKLKKQEEKIQTQKAAQKRIEKQKKKDESNKTLQKFKVKYPYYISEDKIRFPIEDKLLFIYKDYFEPSENRPVPIDHPIIPNQLVGDFMELENFIVSFHKQFQQDYRNGEYRKSVLYTIMDCKGSDQVFEQLLGAIIKIYLKDIFEKNKTENVKILNDHSFFILLGTINEANQMTAEYVAFIAPEIIRHLSNVPSMKNAFVNFVFPEEFNLETKLKTLISLIQGLSQVDGFHEMVGRKSQKIAEMTKDKADFVTKLKKNEAQALSNKQKLKQILGKNQNKTEDKDVEIISDEKEIKEIQKTKKKTQKMATDGEKSDIIIKEYKSKIVKIARMIPFAISQIMFLGNDRNRSSYYFYLREPNRIYVRYHSYLLDNNEEFKLYEGKQKIMEVLKSLNTKGIHEKHLSQSINYLIKEDILRNLTTEQELQGCGSNFAPPIEETIMFETEGQFRKKVIDDMLEIQNKFSTYLTIKNCRWTSDTKREEFLFGFPFIDNVQAMKQAIKNMQESFLFVQVIRDQQRQDQSDSNNEDHNGNSIYAEKQSKRKKPIRIWGINSEKIKKFWMEYLETCIDYTGVWISVFIFKKYVEKYLDKKMEHIREQERRQTMEREKEQRQKKLREQRERQKEERNLDRLRSRDKAKLHLKKSPSSNEPIEISNSEGMKTRRRLRASTTRLRNKPLTLDSDQDEQQVNQEQESVNQDECAICAEVGDVICCDTCPKVFHLECLKIKQIPEGDWSCVDCLQRLANERQTRSKARRINR